MPLVKITTEHIERGKVRDCSKCPMALAIQEMLREEFKVNISVYDVSIHRGGNPDPLDNHLEWAGSLTPGITGWIRRFDKSMDMPPAEFELHIPEQYLKEPQCPQPSM